MLDEDNNGRDEVRFRAPGGFEAQFRGRYLPNLLRFVIFLLLALLFVLGYQANNEMKIEHSALKAAIEQQVEVQREATYILTLTQPQREALNLTMPDSLRKRIRMGLP